MDSNYPDFMSKLRHTVFTAKEYANPVVFERRMLNHAVLHLLEYYRQQHIHIIHRVIHRFEAKFQRISPVIHIRTPWVIPSVSFGPLKGL